MSSNLKDINFAELTKEQIENIERQNKATLRSSYMMEFTKKRLIKVMDMEKLTLSSMVID